jgi:hypothetical protein
VTYLRALRVSASVQLALPVAGESSQQCWWRLPAETRTAVVTLLARLIARGVVVEDEVGGDGDG